MSLKRIMALFVQVYIIFVVLCNIFYKISLSNGNSENEKPKSSTQEDRDLKTKTFLGTRGNAKEIKTAKESSGLDTKTSFGMVENKKTKSNANDEPVLTIKSVPGQRRSKTPLSDFITYPCLTKGETPLRLKNGGCVRTVNITLGSKGVPITDCVELKIAKGTPICTYDPKIDKYVSGKLRSHGTWERSFVRKFGLALNANNITHVLDIGCNIGVYSLKAAKLGKYVVSLDANFRNLRLLSKSLILGKLSNSVALIWNALSDVYTNVTVYNSRTERNIGGNSIHAINAFPGNEDILSERIMLDDLAPLFRKKTVAIKMDIESSKLKALKGGTKFLGDVNVRFIQMEILMHKNKTSGSEITSMMDAYCFSPFRTCLREDDLKNEPIKSWPNDVVL